jgi:uncharacterized RDD family membrane protein YckC
MLDTIHTVQTPEGVELNLRVAGPVVRGIAWGTDLALRTALYVGFAMTMGLLGRFGQGLSLIAVFLVEWFYPVFFELFSRGQTPGKKLMGIRVVNENGTPVAWPASVARNLLRFADFLPGFYALGLASMLLDSSFRRLGDLAAGTIVVYSVSELAPTRAIPAAPPLAPPLPLVLSEQRAVIAYAERSPFLSEERAQELAAIPAPLLAGDDPRERLFRIAAWLSGPERSARAR